MLLFLMQIKMECLTLMTDDQTLIQALSISLAAAVRKKIALLTIMNALTIVLLSMVFRAVHLQIMITNAKADIVMREYV